MNFTDFEQAFQFSRSLHNSPNRVKKMRCLTNGEPDPAVISAVVRSMRQFDFGFVLCTKVTPKFVGVSMPPFGCPEKLRLPRSFESHCTDPSSFIHSSHTSNLNLFRMGSLLVALMRGWVTWSLGTRQETGSFRKFVSPRFRLESTKHLTESRHNS